MIREIYANFNKSFVGWPGPGRGIRGRSGLESIFVVEKRLSSKISLKIINLVHAHHCK